MKLSEETQTILGQLLQIYQLLVNQPDPEEEEEAQKELLNLLTDLEGQLDSPELWEQVKALKTIVEKWDTLESWYTEVEKLDVLFKEMLKPFFPEIFKDKSQESIQKESDPLAKTEPKPTDAPTQPMQDRIQSRLQAMEEKMSAFVQKEHPQKVATPLPTPKPKETLLAGGRIKAGGRPPTHSELTKHNVQFTTKTKRPKLQAPKIIIPKLAPKNPLVTRQSVPAILTDPGLLDTNVASNLESPPIDANTKAPIFAPVPAPTPAPAPFNSIPHIIPSSIENNQKSSTPTPAAFHPKITQIKSSSRIVRQEETPDLNIRQVSAPIPSGNVSIPNDPSGGKKSIPLETHSDQLLAQSRSDVDQHKYKNLVQLEAKKVYYTQQIQMLQSELENGHISNGDFQQQLSAVNSMLLHCSTDIASLQQKLKKQ